MIVIHSSWSEPSASSPVGGFLLWGEGELAAPVVRRRGRGRRKASADATERRHPYLVAPERLSEALETLIPGCAQANGAMPLLFELRLPTRDGRPATSPILRPMLEREKDAMHPFALERWQVEGLLFPTVKALGMLSSVPLSRAPVGQHVMPGGSLLFWSAAAKLSLQVLARGHFVPIAEEGEGGIPRAGWLPLLTDADVESTIERLADAMPAMARIPPHFGGTLAGPRPSRALIERFLTVTVDETARAWCYNRYAAQQAEGLVVRMPDSAWMAAMVSGSALIRTGTPLELKDLPREARRWTAPLVEAVKGAPYRTCFRLESMPPDEANRPGEDWVLRFYLQAKDDPNLLVPADDVWRAGSRALRAQGKRFDNAQETLLADLARAARIYAPLEPSLHDPAPSGCPLTSDGAFHFLAHGAPQLHQAGLGVVIPQEIKTGAFEQPTVAVRVKVRAAERSAAKSSLGIDTLLDFDWEIALGDQVISREEFLRLIQMKVPLVKLNGRMVVLSADALKAAARFAERSLGQMEQMTVGQALAMAAGVTEGTEKLPALQFEGDGWLASLFKPGSADPTPTPVGFCGQLRPYQERGLHWLACLRDRGLGACLADDMGLGKTIQLLTLLLREQERMAPKRPGPTLLICPTSVVTNWERETKRFAPSLSLMVHHGADRRTGTSFAREAAKHHLVISTYSLVARDLAHLQAVEWLGVVLDEAQNVKNDAAKQSQAVRQLRGQYRAALTGTPIENRLSELWSLMDFLNPGYLGTGAAFKRNFAYPIERFGDSARANQLRKLVAPFVLRRLKTDPTVISDLPEKQEMKVYCSLTKEQASLYEAVVEQMMAKLKKVEGIQRRGHVLASLTKLKQICNHPTHYLAEDDLGMASRSGKLARLEEMLEELLDTDDRALIFTQYAEMGKLLKARLAERFGIDVPFLYGSVPTKHRQQMVDDFQAEEGGPRVFLLSLKAGGLGLNLTRANHVFHFDRWWNPAVEDQATDRSFRIGQTRNVQVHKLISAGTLEERIDFLIERKRGLADKVVGTGEAWLTEMTNDELQELVQLQKDAIGDD
jgi:superfamily II DNA or RNA helicase